ncbi:MAG TPA: class I adenylate-forming enzyme family protein [Candidatus Paceibacterota bacterium]
MEITEFEKNGKKQTFKPVFGSIAELLEHHAKEFGKKEAIIAVNVDLGEEHSISYKELLELAQKAAGFLAEKGVQKGDRVAFAFENTATILILELAAGLLGTSSVPIDVKRDTPERKEFKLKDANAKVFFDNEQEVLEGVAKSPALNVKKPDFGLGAEYLLLYTSGTTANPKGVPLSLRAMMANAQGIAEWQKLSAEDRFGIVLPLHHINSTTMSLATLLAGGTIVLSSRYSASRFWEAASKHAVTITSIVPTILHDLLARKEEYFSKKYPLYFKRILIGSAPVLPEETMRFMETFGIDVVQGYGQTETALRVTGVPIDLPRPLYRELTKRNSIGKELAYCNVTVLKEGRIEAKENEEGELCIRGPVLGDGYWNNKEATEKEFFEGWFHSGDLGYYEIIQRQKYFFIKGRIKEIIIKGGVNISPAAVEDALLKNFPEINEVCVVGYEDSRMGEEVAAVITVRSLTSNRRNRASGKELVEKITRFGAEGKLVGLSRYEAPSKVFVLDEELPKTSTGKIQRVKVKEMVALRQAQGKQKDQHLYCRFIEPHEKTILKKAVEINNKRWPVASSQEEFEQRAKNGYLVGVFDEEERLLGTLSALQMTSAELEAAKTWDAATSKGTLQNNNPNGEIMVCASITVTEDTKAGTVPALPEVSQALADAVVEDYVKTGLDNVLRFHAKPKGGMQKGAKLIKILPQGRPEDAEAMGYNVLVEYPKIEDKKIVRSKSAPPSFLLVEHAMQLAKEKNCTRVIAFSRPAQFRLHLAKSLDPSVNFEPKDKKTFTKFATLVKKSYRGFNRG